MATIALYAGKINQMPSLIGEVRKSVDNYSSELFSLKSKALNIRKTVCDLDDVIGMIQASTEIQEQKAESLEAFRHPAGDSSCGRKCGRTDGGRREASGRERKPEGWYPRLPS